MCEITRENFSQKFPEIQKSFEKSKFIAVDLEFSALAPSDSVPSLFDTNKERYAKLRTNLDKVIPVQVGLTAFHFNPDDNEYTGQVFTFYTVPALFSGVDRSFVFQTSSLNFLGLHKFDFNKFAYLGVPYLSSVDEAKIARKLKTDSLFGENCHLHCQLERVVKDHSAKVAAWYNNAVIGDYLEIPNVCTQYRYFYEIIFFLHKHFRNKFENVWTYEDKGSFYIKKVTKERLHRLLSGCTLKDDLLKELIGFSHVFKMLSDLQKPIIGHNVMQDLMIMMHNFEMPLPSSYQDFKKSIHKLFPCIFDTKTLYYELRRTIPKKKLADDTSLEGLFTFFKHGPGKNLVENPVVIESNICLTDQDRYHEAGWDSYCAGLIFIRLGYFKMYQEYPKSRLFVSSEIVSGLTQYKNSINVIRGSTAHIKIDGVDPVANRPLLMIQTRKGNSIDIEQVTSMLSAFGSIDVKKLSAKGNQYLIAVDSFRTSREIFRSFKSSTMLQVKYYNTWKHSYFYRILTLSAATVSASVIVWISHSLIRKYR